MNKKEIKQLVKERDDALLSLDKDKIMRYMQRYGIPCPKNEIVFWAGIHKARMHINAATEQQKQESAAWLLQHGFSLDI